MATTAQVELHQRTLRTGFAEPDLAQGRENVASSASVRPWPHAKRHSTALWLTPNGLIDGADGTAPSRNAPPCGSERGRTGEVGGPIVP